MQPRQGLEPTPSPGRRKIALFHDRIRRRSKAVCSDHDYPEAVADLMGGVDYWTRAARAFRFHDGEMAMNADHEVTFVALGNLLGIDRRNATALIRKERIRQSTKAGLYYWRDVRRLVGEQLSERAVVEIFRLRAEAARAQASASN